MRILAFLSIPAMSSTRRMAKRGLAISPSPSAAAIGRSTSRHFASASHKKRCCDEHTPTDEDYANDETKWTFVNKDDTPLLPAHLFQNENTKQYFGESSAVLLNIEVDDSDFSLSQAICSYGYFCLAPNKWIPSEQDDEGILARPLRFGVND